MPAIMQESLWSYMWPTMTYVYMTGNAAPNTWTRLFAMCESYGKPGVLECPSESHVIGNDADQKLDCGHYGVNYFLTGNAVYPSRPCRRGSSVSNPSQAMHISDIATPQGFTAETPFDWAPRHGGGAGGALMTVRGASRYKYSASGSFNVSYVDGHVANVKLNDFLGNGGYTNDKLKVGFENSYGSWSEATY